MLRLTIKKELPDDRDYQRLLEFCQGITIMHSTKGLKAISLMIARYIKFMQLRASKVQVIDKEDQITFGYKNSADVYFTIIKTNLK
jgi:hypothetical protein